MLMKRPGKGIEFLYILQLSKSSFAVHVVITLSRDKESNLATSLLIAFPELFCGFVASAPDGADRYSTSDYQAINVPTVIVRAEEEKGLGMRD